MTGYPSKKASAQDKLTQWLEALHHSQEPESVDAQPDDPTGQAPCVRHCESTAYEIVIRGLKGDIDRLKAAQHTEQEPDVLAHAKPTQAQLAYLPPSPDFYAPPAQRTWVGLTDEEKGFCAAPTYVETVARTEAKLKEKNT